MLLSVLPITVVAQNFHFAARLGIAGYQGDLKLHGITLSQSRLACSVGAQYDFSQHITARSYLSFASLHADDKKGNTSMRARNLNFTSNILDWELSGQYSILNLNEHWWTPYFFGGVGIFHFNPYTKDIAGKKYFLRPLSTEGEGFIAGDKEYNLTQFSLPFGIGAVYSLNEDMRIGIEFGYRKLFTDYLDDVSKTYVDQTALLNARGQKAVDLAYRGYEVNAGPYPAAGAQRGNSPHKDGYYFIQLTYTVRYFFDKYKQIAGIATGPKSRKKVGCPATRNISY